MEEDFVICIPINCTVLVNRITSVMTTQCCFFHNVSPDAVNCWNLSQILATSMRRNANSSNSLENDPSKGTDGDPSLNFGEDDENMVSSTTGVPRGFLNRDKHLRYRTRVFAAEYVMIFSMHLIYCTHACPQTCPAHVLKIATWVYVSYEIPLGRNEIFYERKKKQESPAEEKYLRVILLWTSRK